MAREQPRVAHAAGVAAGAVGRHRAFLCASAPGARGNRIRGPHRPPDGAAAAAVQSRAARPQRAQYHARHPERGAGAAPARRGRTRANEAAFTSIMPRRLRSRREVAARMARMPDRRGRIRQSRAPRATSYGARAAALVEAARGAGRRARGRAARRGRVDVGRDRGEQSRDFRRRPLLPRRGADTSSPARTEHKSVLDSVPRARAAGMAGHLSRARTATACWIPDKSPRRSQPETVLVSIMHVNNEIGIDPGYRGDRRCSARAPSRRGCTWMRRRASAKCAFDFAALGVDLMSLSAHKVVWAQGRRGAGGVAAAGRAAHAAPVRRRTGAGAALGDHRDPSGGGHGNGVCPGERRRPTREARAHRVLAGAALAGIQRARRVYAATASRRARCRICSMSPSRASRAKACSPPSRPESRCRRVRPVLRRSASLPTCCGRLGRDDRLAESSLRFSLGRYSSASDIDTAVDAVTQAVRRLRGISGA